MVKIYGRPQGRIDELIRRWKSTNLSAPKSIPAKARLHCGFGSEIFTGKTWINVATQLPVVRNLFEL
jgi:hypothetical protein